VFPRNVTEFSYRYHKSSRADMMVSFQALQGTSSLNYMVQNRPRPPSASLALLHGDNVQQAHARHMVGGRSPNVMNEVLYRFEFPESPGALNRFLAALSGGWNVSLFHYRNHGSDFGRVLAGIQVRLLMAEFHEFLKELGHTYHDESRNPVYSQFFKSGQ
ncbi:unnamed protein product, partial [Ectocarpus sp. 8 AP-2014]